MKKTTTKKRMCFLYFKHFFQTFLPLFSAKIAPGFELKREDTTKVNIIEKIKKRNYTTIFF